jgi:hypothetical protein
LRVQWCKSRARAKRFEEEVVLVTEEMKRVIRFFEWQKGDWCAKADREQWKALSDVSFEATRAYALRQVAVRDSLITHFKQLWKDHTAHVELMRLAIDDPDILLKFKEEELKPDVGNGKWRKKRAKKDTGKNGLEDVEVNKEHENVA